MHLKLTEGRFLRRYKRFFADVELPRGTVTAHCPNTGTMKTLLNEGVAAWLTHHDNPRRKLEWTLTLLGLPAGGRALVDTGLANRLVEEALRAGTIAELAGYDEVRREVRYGSENSRVDFLLETADRHRPACYVEVKNVTMASEDDPRRSDFPDAVTERGTRHLRELSAIARGGQRAVQFYLLSRSDCSRLGIAGGIDPGYAEALATARAAGVEVLAYRLAHDDGELWVGERCPFHE